MADVLGTIKTAYDLAKDLIEIRDATARASKVGELQSLILQAQEQALAVNEERAALVKAIRDLEAKITQMEKWEAEKERYQLTDFGARTFAYVLKPEMAAGEPSHYLCAACYQKGEKSILQSKGHDDFSREICVCPACKTIFMLGERKPRPPQQTMRRSTPSSWMGN